MISDQKIMNCISNRTAAFIYGSFTKGIIEGIYSGQKDIYNPILFCGDTGRTSLICKEIADHFIQLGKRVS